MSWGHSVIPVSKHPSIYSSVFLVCIGCWSCPVKSSSVKVDLVWSYLKEYGKCASNIYFSIQVRKSGSLASTISNFSTSLVSPTTPDIGSQSIPEVMAQTPQGTVIDWEELFDVRFFLQLVGLWQYNIQWWRNKSMYSHSRVISPWIWNMSILT